MSFNNRVAFITGAGNGIGRSMAREIAQLGGKVVIADIDMPAAERVVAEIGADNALAARCDVSSEESVDQAVSAAVDRFGGIDVLINNAGLHLMQWNRPVTEVSADDWLRILSVNVVGIANCARACRPHLAVGKNPAILNLSSIAGILSENVYGVTKLAVRGLTTALAHELAVDGIRANGIAPGAINSANAIEGVPDDLLDDLINNKQLIHRIGTMADLVEAMKFLCSESSSFITGETLIVGGGYPLRP